MFRRYLASAVVEAPWRISQHRPKFVLPSLVLGRRLHSCGQFIVFVSDLPIYGYDPLH